MACICETSTRLQSMAGQTLAVRKQESVKCHQLVEHHVQDFSCGLNAPRHRIFPSMNCRRSEKASLTEPHGPTAARFWPPREWRPTPLARDPASSNVQLRGIFQTLFDLLLTSLGNQVVVDPVSPVHEEHRSTNSLTSRWTLCRRAPPGAVLLLRVPTSTPFSKFRRKMASGLVRRIQLHIPARI